MNAIMIKLGLVCLLAINTLSGKTALTPPPVNVIEVDIIQVKMKTYLTVEGESCGNIQILLYDSSNTLVASSGNLDGQGFLWTTNASSWVEGEYSVKVVSSISECNETVSFEFRKL